MHVEIDETGRNDEAPRVKSFVSAAAADFVWRCELGHAAIAQENIHRRVQLGGWIDDAATFDQ
jgi:hypothetical protein